jgi:acyl-CoA synthetase (AMP-forming)/AMP-acid ligase II
MMRYLSDINWWKQFGLNVGGVLTSILGFLSILNIQFHWLTAGSINGIVMVILAFGTLFVGSLATLINTYLTDNSKKKAAAVAEDYQAQQEAEQQAEIDKIKAILAQLQSVNTSPVTTPSTTGTVAQTNTPAN